MWRFPGLARIIAKVRVKVYRVQGPLDTGNQCRPEFQLTFLLVELRLTSAFFVIQVGQDENCEYSVFFILKKQHSPFVITCKIHWKPFPPKFGSSLDYSIIIFIQYPYYSYKYSRPLNTCWMPSSMLYALCSTFWWILFLLPKAGIIVTQILQRKKSMLRHIKLEKGFELR